MTAMERANISFHEAKVYKVLSDHPAEWLTAQRVGEIAGISGRTARLHTARFAEIGVADVRRTWPGHRFRLVVTPVKAGAKKYRERLDEAVETFGDSL